MFWLLYYETGYFSIMVAYNDNRLQKASKLITKESHMLTLYANPVIIDNKSLKVLHILAKYIINIVEEADLFLVCPPFYFFWWLSLVRIMTAILRLLLEMTCQRATVSTMRCPRAMNSVSDILIVICFTLLIVH